MKLLLIGFLTFSMAFGVFSGCSPVQFSQDKTKCDVSHPCVTANGLMHVQQELTFTQTNKVDILVVDDNSSSMTTEQNNMANYWGNAVQILNNKGMDWQIGITTTDVCGAPGASTDPNFCPSNDVGAQGTFIGPGTAPTGMQNVIAWSPQNPNPNANTQFVNTIYRPETGSGDERAIFALNLALDKKNSSNAGFFRTNSNLAVIILSDEDERSVGGKIPSDPGYAPLTPYDDPQQLYNRMTTMFPDKNIIVNSIVIRSGDTNCFNIQASQGPTYTAHYGTLYEQLSQLSNGQVGSICDNGAGAFGNMLNNIAAAIANQPTTLTMTLNYKPLLTSQPQVTFNPAANAVSWTMVGSNQIQFGTRPAPGTTVHVEYDYDPSQQ